MTFNEMTEWFLGLEKVNGKTYYPTLKYNLDSLNAKFGNVIVSQIKTADLENCMAKGKEHALADSTIDQEVRAATTMIKKAFDNKIVGGETLKSFKRAKKLVKRNANARHKILTLDKFNRLMAHLSWHTRGILATGFYTGMRRGEILSLNWDKVDLKNRMIHLEAADTKDRKPRTIPICTELYEMLSRIPPAVHDNHVFLYEGKPIRDIRTALERACREVGICYGRSTKDGFVFHDLRHTFNTYMRKAGVPESVIMKITGHSTREMFDRYNTVDGDDAKQAFNQFRAFLLHGD